jgi:hypothetical protein
VTTLSFDIFARNHSSKEFDRLSRDLKRSVKDFDDFGNRAAKSFLSTANSLSNIPTAAAALQGVGSIVGGLSGVLGLLPAAAAAAAAGFATLAVGTAGFADGLKELADTSKIQKGASGVADAAVQSARRIEEAQAGLARAQRSTRDAQEALTRAQVTAREAQVNLTRARERATEQLEDLRRAVSGAALDEEAAVLAVERAQERLREARASGASALDLREAELGIRQAEQALVDTRDRYADLRRESEQANAAGVEGSDEVVSAQQQVADAARGVRDAQEGVADAAQNVRDAQREVARAFEDAARGAGKAASALSGSTEAFDKLSANAQATVRAILGLDGAWMDLRHSVQDALFAGVADEVKVLGGTYIPVLKSGMTGVAQEFNTGAHSVARFLAEGEQVKTINSLFGGTKGVVGNLTDTMQPLLAVLLDVVAVGTEMLPGLTSGFGAAAERAAAFVHDARETGQLREWIQGGLDTLHQLGTLFSQVGQIVSAVFKGLGAGGTNFLDTLIRVTATVRDFLQSFEGQQALKAVGQALRAVSAVVTEVMLTAFQELAPVIVELAPGFAELARQVGTVLVVALQALGPLLQWVAGFLSDNMNWIGPLAIALFGLVKAFQAVTVVLNILKLAAATNPWLLIIAATVLLATLIITHWDQIMGFLSRAWEWIQRTAGDAWDHIKSAIVDPIVDAARWVENTVSNIINWFADIPRRIGSALAGLGRVIGDAFKFAFNLGIDAINWFIDRANDAIYGINVVNPFDNIPYLPHIARLHSGGEVPGMPGQESLWILEAGETVLPADWAPSVGPTAMNGAGMGPPPSLRTGSVASEQPAPIKLILQSDGTRMSRLQLEMLRESIRVEGGDVQVVLGS